MGRGDRISIGYGESSWTIWIDAIVVRYDTSIVYICISQVLDLHTYKTLFVRYVGAREVIRMINSNSTVRPPLLDIVAPRIYNPWQSMG